MPAFKIDILQTKGSLFATRPTLNTYIAKRADLLETAKELFDVVASRACEDPGEPDLSAEGPAEAHRDLEARKTTGSTILVPDL